MAELLDLLTVHGEIDTLLLARPDLRHEVAPLLTAYEDPGAVGWYGEFQEWTRATNADAAFPALDEALGRLARTPTRGRRAARRLLAIAALARVAPVLDSDADALGRALAVEGIQGPALAASDDRELLTFVTEELTTIERWAHFVEEGVVRGVLTADLAIHAAVPPCASTFRRVGPTGAASFSTHFETPAITFERACHVLDPGHWPACAPWFWCAMDLIGQTPAPARLPIYHERVSLDCADHPPVWSVDAYLVFETGRTPDAAWVNYDLADGVAVANPQILVDRGYLIVRRRPGGGVVVDTVKEIAFAPPFSNAVLAAIMCPLGYAHAAEDLVLDCSGEDEPAGPAPLRTVHPAGTTDAGSPESAVVTTLTGGIEECADAYRKSYAKARAGNYGTNDLARDAAASWARYVRLGAELVAATQQAAHDMTASHPPQADPPAPRPQDGP